MSLGSGIFIIAYLSNIFLSSNKERTKNAVGKTATHAPSYKQHPSAPKKSSTSHDSSHRQNPAKLDASTTNQCAASHGNSHPPNTSRLNQAQVELLHAPARVERKEYWDGLPPSDALDCRQCDSCTCTDCETETDSEDFYDVADYE